MNRSAKLTTKLHNFKKCRALNTIASQCFRELIYQIANSNNRAGDIILKIRPT